MRRGGGGGGRGRGGGRGGYGRRDARPGGGASPDDRDRRDRRPDYRPRRSPSPDRRPRRPRTEDDHRDVPRSDRDRPRGGRMGYGGDRNPTPPRGGRTVYGGGRDPTPPRGGRTGYAGGRDPTPPRGGRMGYGADRDSTPPRGGRLGYCGDRDLTPPRGGRTGYGGDRDPSLPRGGRTGYGGDHDPPGRGHLGYDDPRDMPGRGRRDYGDDRDGSRRGPRDYGRVPYRDERDRSGRGDRDASGSYEAPPEYMHPDHPSNLGRPSLRAGKKESYFGGPSDWSLNRDSEYFGGPGRRSINKERELFGDDGMTLRISATESGRTSALYQDRRSPPLPPQAVLSPPPPPLYPSVLPIETGLFTGGSAMEANDGFGAGSTRLLRDDGEFKYHEHLRDPYVGRGREIGRNYLGNRDALVKEDVGTERLFCAGGAPVGRDRETERLYSSRRMLGSGLVPCSQLKQSGDSSSSLLAKDQPYGMHSEPGYEPSNGYIMDGLGRPSHDSLGHGSGHGRLSGSSLEHGSGRGDEALLDITRQVHSKHALRAESMEYDAHDEYGTRDPINGTYVAPENLHGSVLHNLRHMSGSASLRGLKGERINHHLRLPHRMEEDEDSFQAMRHDTEHNVQHSYDADAPIQYPPARGGNDRHSHSPGTEPIGIARQPARQHEFASFEDLSDQEVSPMVSRKRYRSPAYSDDEMDMYQVGDGFTGRKYYADDMDAYDLSPSRMSRSYDMVDDGDEYARYEILTSRNVFSRLALPDETIGEWTDVDQGNHPHAKMLAYERPKHKPISQRLSRPFAQSQFGGPSMYGRGRGGGGMTKSAKKRLKTAAHQFHGGYTSERTEFIRPNNFSKSPEDDPNGSVVKDEDAPEYEDLPMQKDPPEGSEEFSRQVHEAFLKYAKILNENPAMQKKYREESKGSLSCCVCGSVARKFPDLDALLSHAYNTCKVGLKTKHLGFHKALCVLMGWNWHVAPDTSKAHHSIPAEEVNAMNGDLMLWPPVVVIHNSSIANNAKDTETKIVSIEEVEGVLADIGVPREKAKVSHGRPADQSVFLVKFQPTVSGFQEAMRVHDHFSTRNHGKEEFQQMRGGKGKKAAPVDNLEELLYGHIAVAEDLGYLDEGTKRRCVIRSKMDTEAKADATLNLEP